MKVLYTKSALTDFRAIKAYTLTIKNQTEAKAYLANIVSEIKTLIDFPTLGKAGREKGTREFVISKTPFIVVYRIETDEIHILAIVHNSRHWPGTA